jgi:putative ABC transport system permease protein
MVRQAPLTGTLPPNDLQFETRPASPDDPVLNADVQVVSADYFTTLGIPLLRGRTFDARDDETSELAFLVDEAFVRRFFPDRPDVIGEGVRQAGYEDWGHVVGVVGNVRQEALDREPRPHLYLVHAQSPRAWYTVRAMTVLLRTGLEPLSLVGAVRGAVRGLDPNLPAYRVTTVERTVADSAAAERFSMSLQLVFAGVALVLAMIGIYGVLSYSVAQRTREIGIRMALGAERRSILRLVVGQGMALVLAAVVVGVLGALAAGRVLSSLLYGVSPRDPLTFGAVAAALSAVALVACWIPARRASAVSPQTALRSE